MKKWWLLFISIFLVLFFIINISEAACTTTPNTCTSNYQCCSGMCSIPYLGFNGQQTGFCHAGPTCTSECTPYSLTKTCTTGAGYTQCYDSDSDSCYELVSKSCTSPNICKNNDCCRDTGTSCSSNSQCCSTVCSSIKKCCKDIGQSCTISPECCSNTCSNGQCIQTVTQCKTSGSCSSSSECCTGYTCSNGQCVTPLQPAITINGYVKDSQNNGIANVKVEAIDAKSDGGCPIDPPAKNSFTTASDGYYSFTFPSISGLCDYVLVTASKSGCTFSPTEYRSKFTGNDINKNFIGSCSLCVPNCINKQCGNDGCGGTCPPGCPSNQICNYVTGQCVSSQEGLSEIQLIACETAENNNNCDKLQNISLVTKEQCCSYLNMCCTSNNIVSKQEFLSVLMSVIKNYFINPSNAKLNLNEIKDLVVAYLSVPKDTQTIDLSSIGSFSKEKLIDIYNKAKGTTSSTFNYKIMNSQTDQTKKSVYNIGDSITNYWSNLPQYAYSSSSNCKVYFWYYNVISDDKQFYVPCGDSGLGTYNQVKYDTGTLTSEHCFGKTGQVTNTIQMIIKNNTNNVLAQSNSDSYTINCPTTPTPHVEGEILPWDITYRQVQLTANVKKTYILHVEPKSITYGQASFISLDPNTEFNFIFTLPPGVFYVLQPGKSSFSGHIAYGILDLPFDANVFTPVPADGFVPAGDYILEITLSDNPLPSRIVITTGYY